MNGYMCLELMDEGGANRSWRFPVGREALLEKLLKGDSDAYLPADRWQ